MNIWELKAERADMALRELNTQIHSHRMELHHANQVFEKSRREQASLQADLEKPRKRLHQETRFRTFQEMEELKGFAVLKLRITNGCFSRHELRESQSTVNYLTNQIQELQVSSLNGT